MDVLARNVSAPYADKGDLLIIFQAGAYGLQVSNRVSRIPALEFVA